MGFRARCRFCPQKEFGNMATHRRHIKWHVNRGDAVVMEQTERPTIICSIKGEPLQAAEPTRLLCRPEEVAELERQGWTRQATTEEETQ